MNPLSGRYVLYANYTEKELLSGSREEQGQRILKILKDDTFQSLHEINEKETRYLIDYMYGDQDIKNKTKKTRTDINNTGVENWAYAFVDWKKTFLLGKPVQYAPMNDASNEEIIELNNYMSYEDKNVLDIDLWEDVLACGRGFRYSNSTKVTEEDEAPFELVNLDPWKCEVVYSSGINKEQLCSYIQTRMEEYREVINEINNEKEMRPFPYSEWTVYTRNTCFVIDNKGGEWKITSIKPLILNEHIITEYYLNKRRISIIELGKDIFDNINYVENLDLDDIEQFVNSIMVFTNAEVNKEGMDAIKEYGAVSIKSTEQKRASVEILQSRLKSLDTQIYYLRKISALHQILSVPQASASGEVSNAETGKAVLTGQGFTSASVRVAGEDIAFKSGDKQSLKTILKICKRSPKSKIKTLKVSDIEIKLTKDLSDNLLTKTQALMNLQSANIPPEVRNQIVNLFSDPVNVSKLQAKYEEERNQLANELNKRTDNNENKINEQNNKIKNVQEKQNQEQ